MTTDTRKIKIKGNRSKSIIAIVALVLVVALILITFGWFQITSTKVGINEGQGETSNTQTTQVDNSGSDDSIPGPEAGSHTGSDTRLTTSSSDNSTRPTNKVCYLTFDDGPSSNTERIISILNKNKIKATWFVKTDNAAINKVKTIWENGNQVAVHTHTHSYTQIYASPDAFWADHDTAYQTIASNLGFSPAHIFRFPGGSTNSYNSAVASTIFSQATSKHEHFFDWNQSCGDGAEHAADEIVGYATADGQTKNSVCLLMHDSDAKNTTVEALDRIIQFYKSNGFSFEYITEDTFGYHL